MRERFWRWFNQLNTEKRKGLCNRNAACETEMQFMGQGNEPAESAGFLEPGRSSDHHNDTRYSLRRSRLRSSVRRTASNLASFEHNRHAHSHAVRRNLFAPTRPRTRSVTSKEAEELNKTQSGIPPLSVAAQVGEYEGDSVASAQWEPSIVIGSPVSLEGEDLSRIEMADRKIAQRRLWAEHYQGAGDFLKLLEEALDERKQLDENDKENTVRR